MTFDANRYKRNFEKEKYAIYKIRIPKHKRHILEELSESNEKSINRIFIEAVERVHKVDLTYDLSELFKE